MADVVCWISNGGRVGAGSLKQKRLADRAACRFVCRKALRGEGTMGLLDNASNLLNKGVANASRGTKVLSLKAQIADLDRTRNAFMSKLGESLYEETRTSQVFREGRETLYGSIEHLEEQRMALQQELAVLERQMSADPVHAATSTLRCPQCGGLLEAGDQFCSICGAQCESSLASSRCCASCGSELGVDDAFCMNCGASVASALNSESAGMSGCGQESPGNQDT